MGTSLRAVAGPTSPIVPRTSAAFFAELFRLLDRYGVRYCVLHAYESLPQSVPSDLDMALHPRDMAALAVVFSALRRQGYIPLQLIDYEAGSYYFVFGWIEDDILRTTAIDFTTEHREGHLILLPATELLRGRVRRGLFWIPQPLVEFRYLLSKKVLKRSLHPNQSETIASLAAKLGPAGTASVTAALFGEPWKEKAAEACATGAIGRMLADLNQRFRRTLRRRDPLNPLRYRLTNLPRLARRFCQPAGLFVSLLGPDGSGKSTLRGQMVAQLGGAFRSTTVLHWRPMLLGGKKKNQPETDPHGRPPYGYWHSIARLGFHMLDYWVGYWFMVRPLLVRSGLVLFERYFDDMLVDPRRYRYGGPMCLLRWCRRLVRRPDLRIVLDAPERTVLSRKRELAPEELRRQRLAYAELPAAGHATVRVDAGRGIAEVAGAAVSAVTGFLEKRFARRHGQWLRSRDGEPDRLPRFLAEFAAGTPESSVTRRFIGIPSLESPRWLLPAGDRRAVAGAFQVYTPYKTPAKLYQRIVPELIGRVPRKWLNSRALDARQLPASLDRLVAEAAGEKHPVFSFSFGAAGAWRKVTAQVMRPDGRVLGYCKIALTGPAEERIRNEAFTLACLRAHESVARHVPKILFAGRWQGWQVLFQSPVPGAPGPAQFGRKHREFLRALHELAPVNLPGSVVVTEVATRWSAACTHLGGEAGRWGDRALDMARRELEDVPVPCGLIHGDFAPWNTRVSDGRLLVFDWETAASNRPIWWDVFHFETQVGDLLGRHANTRFDFERNPGSRGVYLLYLLDSLANAAAECPGDPRGSKWREQALRKAVMERGEQ